MGGLELVLMINIHFSILIIKLLIILFEILTLARIFAFQCTEQSAVKYSSQLGLCRTLEGGRQGRRQDEQGPEQVHNAEVLDKNKADDLILDIIAADIEDYAAVGDNCEDEDDKDQRTLQHFGKHKHSPRPFFFCSQKKTIFE